MHDRIAELRGLRNELATCVHGPDTARREDADLVREQITRVRDELAAEADRQDKRAEDRAGSGQDTLAAAARALAYSIRAALDAATLHAALDDEYGSKIPAKPTRRGKQAAGKQDTAAPKAPEQT